MSQRSTGLLGSRAAFFAVGGEGSLRAPAAAVESQTQAHSVDGRGLMAKRGGRCLCAQKLLALAMDQRFPPCRFRRSAQQLVSGVRGVFLGPPGGPEKRTADLSETARAWVPRRRQLKDAVLSAAPAEAVVSGQAIAVLIAVPIVSLASSGWVFGENGFGLC